MTSGTARAGAAAGVLTLVRQNADNAVMARAMNIMSEVRVSRFRLHQDQAEGTSRVELRHAQSIAITPRKAPTPRGVFNWI